MKKSIIASALVMSSVLTLQGGGLQNDRIGTSDDSKNNIAIVKDKQPSVTSGVLTASQKLALKHKKYKNGVYKITTPQDGEKYYTKAKLTIKKGKIASVSWTIYDAGHNNEPFDDDYYKVMQPYGDLYAQQAKDDWKGSRGYAKALIKTQNIDKVDAVTGATWACNKFKEAVEMALVVAKKK